MYSKQEVEMKVRWQPRAAKQLIKLKDKLVIKRVNNAVLNLVKFPDVNNIKALSNHSYQYRLIAGDYRVFFNVNEAIEIVVVEEVKKRDERTY